ncbi:hypothetical protein B9T31_17355 [Acinetobacter sp. ANC 4558]|uniref:hypothetical protein n=1 Tax=Acinetobacter sp. ANC 4558 TaxID=1977876 RepID=UPI000A334191|nr:hypothetical protein [Acinetobacter sp. ANC 4558]OTG79066.1 hypothetical protein B9T31_17355 [Acinetobacter sp. ANC 4558]
MKVIYTNDIPTIRLPDACYRTTFLGPIVGATSVEIDEDFPDADLVEEAYGYLALQQTSIISDQTTLIEDHEKLIAENEQLQARLKESVPQGVYDEVCQERTRLEQEIVGIKNDLEKVTAERDALKSQVLELEAKVKKPTAAELKAAKAAEDAAKLEEPKE